MMMFHFGCRRKPGHFLTYPDGRHVRDYHESKRLRIPAVEHLDSTALFLPHPEVPGHGALTYLPANDRTVLAWWDRTYDGRPNCNMALIAEGRRTLDEIWAALQQQFTDIAPDLSRPVLVERSAQS